jgi:hypothetical protein
MKSLQTGLRRNSPHSWLLCRLLPPASPASPPRDTQLQRDAAACCHPAEGCAAWVSNHHRHRQFKQTPRPSRMSRPASCPAEETHAWCNTRVVACCTTRANKHGVTFKGGGAAWPHVHSCKTLPKLQKLVNTAVHQKARLTNLDYTVSPRNAAHTPIASINAPLMREATASGPLKSLAGEGLTSYKTTLKASSGLFMP